MRPAFAATSLGVWLCWVTAMTGCRPSEDPAVLAQRQHVLLAAEPAGALGVSEARQTVAGEPRPLVLVGRVGAGPAATWDPTQAAFVIADLASSPEELAHDHTGDHAHCPFCKAKAKKSHERTALIQVVDQNGTVIPIDARRLLAIKEYQTVVVRGMGYLDALGNLVVSADGVYPRR